MRKISTSQPTKSRLRKRTKVAVSLAALGILLVMGYPDVYYDDYMDEPYDDYYVEESVDSSQNSCSDPDSYGSCASTPDPAQQDYSDSGNDPYSEGDPLSENIDWGAVNEFSDFDQCVLEQLDPDNACLDFDSKLSCAPAVAISDEELVAVCGDTLAHDALGADDADAVAQKKIGKIREVLKKGGDIKASIQNLAELILPGPYADGEQDALRHMLGAAFLCRATPSFLRGGTLAVLNAREDTTTASGQMDIHNNTLGCGLAGDAPKGEDWLCYTVIEALKKIKNGTAKVISSNPAQRAKVDYWLNNLDELRELLGCKQPIAADTNMIEM